MGLFGGNKQSQSTTVEDTSAGANVGGNTTAPVTSNAISIGGTGKSPINGGTFTFTDSGAIAAGSSAVNRSFDFAAGESERSFTLAEKALEKATSAFNTSRDATNSAYQQSLTAVSAAREPADEKTREQFTWLALGALVLVGFIIYTTGGKA